uniref:USP domain-containing protein n=1 Tax=Angiostrongylus cantonensis TaxID=6313 RepID=A0A0K0DCN4_ANGCA
MTRVGKHAQLRGLLNMGSTCYMNSVLQALVHTPVLRDYFLSDQHSCQRSPGTCLMCTMHQLMQVISQKKKIWFTLFDSFVTSLPPQPSMFYQKPVSIF